MEFETFEMKKLLYIARYPALAALLLLLLALAPAMAQNVVYQGETTTLTVDQMPGDSYFWEIYSDGTVNFATVPGNCPVTSAIFVGGNTGTSVDVKWLQPGIYFFKVTAQDITGCTNNIKIGMVEVKPSIPTAVLTQPDPDWICIGDQAFLEVTLTGVAPWEFTYTDGTSFWTVKNIAGVSYQLQLSPKATAQYWITSVKDINGTNPAPSARVLVVVNPKPESSKIYQHEP
ncbi:MAG: hypothetical protein C0397_01925 [Odoribacter sp.]|nr:hypothetical protein [Odoribacter sp.]